MSDKTYDEEMLLSLSQCEISYNFIDWLNKQISRANTFLLIDTTTKWKGMQIES